MGKKSSNSKSLTILPNGQTLILRQIEVIKKDFPDSEIILTVGPEATNVINRINDIENKIKEMINDIIIEIADVNFYINYLTLYFQIYFYEKYYHILRIFL